MLWLADNNYVHLSFIRVDASGGRVTASGGIRDKRPNGKVVYHNIDVRFYQEAAQKAAQIKDRATVRVTRAMLEMYESRKYKTDKGKPITMCALKIFDFDIPNWDNGSNTGARPSAPRATTAPAAPAERLPWEEEGESPL